MDDFVPLNPELYNALRQNFGRVKTDKKGQGLKLRTVPGTFEPEILAKGETYRVRCPWCNDTKFKLNVNHSFGTEDGVTGRVFYINKCYRCGPKTNELRELITWLSIKRITIPTEYVELEDEEIVSYVSPGRCVLLTDPQAKPGADYLAGRGIDPVEAANVYGVSFCVEGNPELCGGGMQGRLIFPVTKDGEHKGWQARLARDPNVFDKDRNFQHLRWYTMPGEWRSRYFLGYDQARRYSLAVLVEGPTDLVKQGPPCIASLGQTLSFGQARLLRETWSQVAIVGDHQKKADGTENAVQKASLKLLKSQDFDAVHLIKLPEGDPGSWARAEFAKFVRDRILENPKGENGSANIGTILGHG